MRDGPGILLTRHFFGALFDFGFLTNEGREAFERVLLGAAAVAVGLGLALARLFLIKYASFSEAPAERYLAAVGADHAFLIALSMWIVALSVALVGHALFPDEIDLRILMPEPISRATIFGAKLAALSGFVALLVAAAAISLAPMFLLTMVGPPGTGPLVGWLAAYVVASVAGSVFAAVAVIALNALLVLIAPLARVAAPVRSMLVFSLMLSLLFIVQLPTTASAFAADAWWLRLAPPMWFVGLEYWLLGYTSRAPLAQTGAAAFLAAGALNAVAYWVLYRHFHRTMARPAGAVGGSIGRRNGWHADAPGSVREAVTTFVSITLRRSILHQGTVVMFLAGAVGFVAARFLAAGFPHQTGKPWLLFWSPLTLIFIAAPAVRLALSLPIQLRANWMFRMTEEADTRAAVAAASVRTVIALGVVLPVAIMLPWQWLSLGPRTVPLASVELAVGWLFVEVLMRDWQRLPFACSYVPGKGFVPHMFVKGLAAFALFTSGGGRVLAACARTDRGLWLLFVIVATPALVLLVRRDRRAARIGLAFEDQVPSEINPLRL